MGLQPIDLQTMYSQVANVAKQASFEQQGLQLSQSMQQREIVKQNAEEALKVKQTEEQSKSSSINKDGKSDTEEQQKQKKKNEAEEAVVSDENKPSTLKPEYLGQHIDITR